MAGSAIEAGRGFVRVDADLNPLQKALGKIEGVMKGFGSKISGIGAGVAGVGAGVGAIGAGVLAPIAAATAKFANFGSEIKDVADRTGISAKSVSEFGYAAEQSGTDLETVEGATRKMQKGITQATMGSKSMSDAFGKIGLSAKQLANLSPEDQFTAVAKAVGDVKDPTQRAAAAMSVFGKSGAKLLPMIKDIDELRKEANDLGISISDIDASNAENLGDAFSKFGRVVGGIGNQIGAAIAVPLTKIVNTISAITATASKWIAANQGVVKTIAMIAAGAVAVGAVITGIGIAIVGVGATFAAIGSIIGGIATVATTVFGAVASAVAFVLSPVGLLIAAVVGLGAYITYTALSATGSLTKLSEMFGSLGDTATTAWGGIVAAVSTGDLEAAGQIAFTALEVAWLTITGTIQQVWSNVSAFFVNTWLSAVESIVKIGSNIYFGVAKYFDLITVSLVGAFDNAGVGIYGAVDQITTYIYGAFDTAITNVMGLFDTIATTLNKLATSAAAFFGAISKDEAAAYNDKATKEFEKRTGERNTGLDTRRNERQSNLDTRATDRQSNLDGRANERQSGLDSRDTQRRATADQFNAIVGEDFKRKQAKVDNSGLTAAQKRLEELKTSLSEKAATAQEKAAEAQKESSTKAETAQASTALATSTGEGSSVGSFVSGIANSITGAGASPLEDLATQQVDLLSSIDGRLREGINGEDE